MLCEHRYKLNFVYIYEEKYIYICTLCDRFLFCKRGLVTSAKIKMVHIAPPGAIKFPMVCYGRKRGTDDGLLGEVSSLLEEICLPLR